MQNSGGGLNPFEDNPEQAEQTNNPQSNLLLSEILESASEINTNSSPGLGESSILRSQTKSYIPKLSQSIMASNPDLAAKFKLEDYPRVFMILKVRYYLKSCKTLFRGLCPVQMVVEYALELKHNCRDSTLPKWSQQSLRLSGLDPKECGGDWMDVLATGVYCFFSAVRSLATKVDSDPATKTLVTKFLESHRTRVKIPNSKDDLYQEYLNTNEDFFAQVKALTREGCDVLQASKKGECKPKVVRLLFDMQHELWFCLALRSFVALQQEQPPVTLLDFDWTSFGELFTGTGDDKASRAEQTLLRFAAEFLPWLLGKVDPDTEGQKWFKISGCFSNNKSSLAELCKTGVAGEESYGQVGTIVMEDGIKGFWDLLLQLDPQNKSESRKKFHRLYLDAVFQFVEKTCTEAKLSTLRKDLVLNKLKVIIANLKQTESEAIVEVTFQIYDELMALANSCKSLVSMIAEPDLVSSSDPGSMNLLVKWVLEKVKPSDGEPAYKLEEIWREQHTQQVTGLNIVAAVLGCDSYLKDLTIDSPAAESLFHLVPAVLDSSDSPLFPECWQALSKLQNEIIKVAVPEGESPLYKPKFMIASTLYSIIKSETSTFFRQTDTLAHKLLIGLSAKLKEDSRLLAKHKTRLQALHAVVLLQNLDEVFTCEEVSFGMVYHKLPERQFKYDDSQFNLPNEIDYKSHFFAFARHFVSDEKFTEFERKSTGFKEICAEAFQALSQFDDCVKNQTQDFAVFESIRESFCIGYSGLLGFQTFTVEQRRTLYKLCTEDFTTKETIKTQTEDLQDITIKLSWMAQAWKCIRIQLGRMYGFETILARSDRNPKTFKELSDCFLSFSNKMTNLFTSEGITKALQPYSDISEAGQKRIEDFEAELNKILHPKEVKFYSSVMEAATTKVIKQTRQDLVTKFFGTNQPKPSFLDIAETPEAYSKAEHYRKFIYCMGGTFEPAGAQPLRFAEFVNKIHTLIETPQFKELVEGRLRQNKEHAEGEQDFKYLAELETFCGNKVITKAEIVTALLKNTDLDQKFAATDKVFLELVASKENPHLIKGKPEGQGKQLEAWSKLYTTVVYLSQQGKMTDIHTKLKGTIWDETAVAEHIKKAQDVGIKIQITFAGSLKHKLANASNESQFVSMDELRSTNGEFPPEFKKALEDCEEVARAFRQLREEGLNPEQMDRWTPPTEGKSGLERAEGSLVLGFPSKDDAGTATMSETTTEATQSTEAAKSNLPTLAKAKEQLATLKSKVTECREKVEMLSSGVCAGFKTVRPDYIQSIIQLVTKERSEQALCQALEYINVFGRKQDLAKQIAQKALSELENAKNHDQVFVYETLTRVVNEVLTMHDIKYQTLGEAKSLISNQKTANQAKKMTKILEPTTGSKTNSPFDHLISSTKSKMNQSGTSSRFDDESNFQFKAKYVKSGDFIDSSHHSMLFLMGELKLNSENADALLGISCRNLFFCNPATKLSDVQNFLYGVPSQKSDETYYILDLHRMEGKQRSDTFNLLQRIKPNWDEKLPKVVVFEVQESNKTDLQIPIKPSVKLHLVTSDVAGTGKSTKIEQLKRKDGVDEERCLRLHNPVNLADKSTSAGSTLLPFEKIFWDLLNQPGEGALENITAIHFDLEAIVDYHLHGYVFDYLIFCLVYLKEFSFANSLFSLSQLQTVYIELNCNLAQQLEKQFALISILRRYKAEFENEEVGLKVEYHQLSMQDPIEVDMDAPGSNDSPNIADLRAREEDYMKQIPYQVIKDFRPISSEVFQQISEDFAVCGFGCYQMQFLETQFSRFLDYPNRVLVNQLEQVPDTNFKRYRTDDNPTEYMQYFSDRGENAYLLLPNFQDEERPLLVSTDHTIIDEGYANVAVESILLPKDNNSAIQRKEEFPQILAKVIGCLVRVPHGGEDDFQHRLGCISNKDFASILPAQAKHLGSYAVGYEVVIKAIYILMMSQCKRVPIIMRGESGCGKTSFVQFLAGISGIGYYFDNAQPGAPREAMIKIHSGLTRRNILDKLDAILDAYESNPGDRDRYCNWIFFDEFNTTPLQAEILDIMISRRYFSMKREKPRDIPENVLFLAACNPYRTSKNKFLEGSKAQTHRVEMTHVNAIPFIVDFQQMNQESFKYNYGILVDNFSIDKVDGWPTAHQTNRGNINQYLNRYLKSEVVEKAFLGVVHKLHEDDPVLISQRDMMRMLDFVGICALLYCQDYPLKEELPLEQSDPRFCAYVAAHSIYTSLLVAVVYRFDALLQDLNIQHELNEIADFFLVDEASAGVEVREARHKGGLHSASLVAFSKRVINFAKDFVNTDWKGDAEAMLDLPDDPKDQSQNTNNNTKESKPTTHIKELPLLYTISLMQNLFVMLGCLKLGTHCFVYGKAGTGKTKSFTIIQQIMKKLKNIEKLPTGKLAETYSNLFDFLKSLKYEVRMYAGSTKSTPEIVEKQMTGHLIVQDRDSKTKILFFFDEMGQADEARALKSYNHQLDEARNQGLVVIGISNTPLDQSIMNRMFCVQRKYQADEVKAILENNSEDMGDEQKRQAKTSELVSAAYIQYHNFVKELKEKFVEPANYFIHELRDLHACKALLSITREGTMLQKVLKIIEINFSGKWYILPEDFKTSEGISPQGISDFDLYRAISNPYKSLTDNQLQSKRIHSSELLKQLILHQKPELLKEALSSDKCPEPHLALQNYKLRGPLELIEENFNKPSSRYLLVYTEDDLTNQLLVQYLRDLHARTFKQSKLTEGDGGCAFHVFREKDHLDFESVAELRNALLKKGNCVVSIDNKHMVFSTYDIANQKSHYSEQEYENFTARLYLEEKSQMLKVPANVKLVFIKNHKDVYNEAFCSRFQKVHVRLSDFLQNGPLESSDQDRLNKYLEHIRNLAAEGLSEAMMFSLLFRKVADSHLYRFIDETEVSETISTVHQLSPLDGEQSTSQDQWSLTSERVSKIELDNSELLKRWMNGSSKRNQVVFTKIPLQCSHQILALNETKSVEVLNLLQTSDQTIEELLKKKEKLMFYVEERKAQRYLPQIYEFAEQNPDTSLMLIYYMKNASPQQEQNPFTGLPFCFSENWDCRYIPDLSVVAFN